MLTCEERISIVRCPKRRASEMKMKDQCMETTPRRGGHVLKKQERISIVYCPKRHASEKKVKIQRVEPPREETATC